MAYLGKLTLYFVNVLKFRPDLVFVGIGCHSILAERAKEYDFVYLCQDSQNAALFSAGSILQVVDTILEGESSCGFSVSGVHCVFLC